MEIWKEIEGYEDYLVSNLGRVKSFKRGKERILIAHANGAGYLTVGLCKEGVKKTKTVHKLVAMAFLNHVPCGYDKTIDHRDNNKLNNIVYNLIEMSQRKNKTKESKGASKYVGVHKSRNKWGAQIYIHGKKCWLGTYHTQEAAHRAYQAKLKELEGGGG
jgi:hypothetical protein